MGDVKTLDMMLGALNCPFGTGHMGITAENVAREQNVTRDDQDEFALESQKRAALAASKNIFDSQINSIEIKVKRDLVLFEKDEHPKTTTLEDLASLRPVFQNDGTVTAGNSSGINDGAAAIVLSSAEAAEKYGLKPKARILGYGHAGVRPEVMGIGPIPAVQNLLKKTGLMISDFDVIESNEAFAAQAIAVNRGLDFDLNIVNPNGGAIALGHPLGMSGARITGSAALELSLNGGRRALAMMCVGVGQGIAVALERVN